VSVKLSITLITVLFAPKSVTLLTKPGKYPSEIVKPLAREGVVKFKSIYSGPVYAGNHIALGQFSQLLQSEAPVAFDAG
jgi:hypothetical protein